jgi:outer membrane immunogenic protein
MSRSFRGVALVAALVGTFSFGSAALAADIPLKAPPLPIWTWTGFYIGGNVGYSWGNANWIYSNPAGTGTNAGSQKLDGLIGGLQIGYNWQVNRTFVLGLEADIQGSAEKGSSVFSDPYFCDSCGGGSEQAVYGGINSDIRWFGTVRGRAGFLLNPTLLLYGTGGLAYGGISTGGTFTDTGIASCTPFCNWAFSQSATRLGWTAGGGIEGAIANSSSWTWKVEYLYVNFGTLSGSGFSGDVGPYSWSTTVTDNIARVGINYLFH